MPPFRSRKTPETEQSEATSELAPPSAEEQLAGMLSERAEIARELAGHREARQRWLRDGGPLARITQLESDDSRLKLRAEQLEALLPDAQEAVRIERAARREARWRELAPDLDDAQTDTVAAITAYDEASDRYRELHWRATQMGFRDELRERFVTPPHQQINPWVFVTFVRTVEQSRQRRETLDAMAKAPPVTFDIEGLFSGQALERFVPRRVDPREVEAISVSAPSVTIRILHGPLRTSNLNLGIARMHVGEIHHVHAKAGHLLTHSGCAEYVDETATVAA